MLALLMGLGAHCPQKMIIAMDNANVPFRPMSPKR